MSPTKHNDVSLAKYAHEIKKDILEISYHAHVGHIGSAFSIADILTVLYHEVLRISPKTPQDPKRDRFILSKGHAASALYATLASRGFFTKKAMRSFCRDGGQFGVHPVIDPTSGIEFSTGSLGHGLSVGAGLAMGLARNHFKSIPRVFVLLSDAELNEGSTWEAVMFASHHKLSNLVAIVDDNNYQAFGKASDVLNLQPLRMKWEAFGWTAKVCDGHSLSDLSNNLSTIPFRKGKPSILIAKTRTAKGISFLENKQEAHYLPLDDAKYKKALKDIERNLR